MSAHRKPGMWSWRAVAATTTDNPAATQHQSAWERYEDTVTRAWAQASEWGRNYLIALPAHDEEVVDWLRRRKLPPDHGPRLAVAALEQYQERVDAAWARYMDEAVTS